MDMCTCTIRVYPMPHPCEESSCLDGLISLIDPEQVLDTLAVDKPISRVHCPSFIHPSCSLIQVPGMLERPTDHRHTHTIGPAAFCHYYLITGPLSLALCLTTGLLFPTNGPCLLPQDHCALPLNHCPLPMNNCWDHYLLPLDHCAL